MSWYSQTEQRTKPQSLPIEVLPPVTLEEAIAEPVDPTLYSSFKPSKYKPGDSYVWKAGDNIWQLAREMDVPVERLMAFNEIEDPHELEPGVTVYYPAATARTRVVEYELLPAPLPMHVSKPGGTRKYAFGNAKVWGDIGQTGPLYAHEANVNVLAVAHVPLMEDNDEEITAAFYMDRLAIGDYANTGRVAWDIGFSHAHLAEGHVDKAIPLPRPDIQEKVADAAVRRVMDVAPVIEVKLEPNSYKTSLKPLYEDRRIVPYLFNDDILVHELDGRRPSKAMFRNTGVNIQCTFEKDGVLYGRPYGSQYWFGIPMDLVTPEDDIFSTEIDLPTKIATRKGLTTFERLIWIPFSQVANSKMFKTKRRK